MKVIVFHTDCAVADRIINHLELSFVAIDRQHFISPTRLTRDCFSAALDE